MERRHRLSARAAATALQVRGQRPPLQPQHPATDLGPCLTSHRNDTGRWVRAGGQPHLDVWGAGCHHFNSPQQAELGDSSCVSSQSFWRPKTCRVVRCEFDPTADNAGTGWVTAAGAGACQLRVGQPPGSLEPLVCLEAHLQQPHEVTLWEAKGHDPAVPLGKAFARVGCADVGKLRAGGAIGADRLAFVWVQRPHALPVVVLLRMAGCAAVPCVLPPVPWRGTGFDGLLLGDGCCVQCPCAQGGAARAQRSPSPSC